MRKKLVLFLICFLIYETSFCDGLKITVRGTKVIFENNGWKDIQHKLPLENLFFVLDDEPIYLFRHTPKQLYIVFGRAVNFKNESCQEAVYSNGEYLGGFLYYCPQDKGIYCENIEGVQRTKYSSWGGVSKYYRIADAIVEKGEFKKVIFPRGTFCSYRYKFPFSWGKDPNHLSIIITEKLNGVSEDYFKNK